MCVLPGRAESPRWTGCVARISWTLMGWLTGILDVRRVVDLPRKKMCLGLGLQSIICLENGTRQSISSNEAT